MGPYEVDYIELATKLLTDWRVIATTVFILLAWALFRYVGLVFKSPRHHEAKLQAKSRAQAQARPAKPAKPEPEAEDEDGEFIE
jgi:hypothetical protein